MNLADQQRMYDTLRRIARAYYTLPQLYKGAEKMYGCTPEEALGMAYENIQADAKAAIKGLHRPTEAAARNAKPAKGG